MQVFLIIAHAVLRCGDIMCNSIHMYVQSALKVIMLHEILYMVVSLHV